MTTGQFIGSIALLLVAVGFVLLNDKLESKKGNKSKAPKEKRLTWKFIACMIAFMATIYIAYTIGGRQGVNIVKWAILGIMALITVGLLLYILFISRKSLWLLFKCLCSGKLPQKMHKDANGNLTIKCPTCSGTMILNEDQKSFKCTDCDETATFQKELKVRRRIKGPPDI